MTPRGPLVGHPKSGLVQRAFTATACTDWYRLRSDEWRQAKSRREPKGLSPIADGSDLAQARVFVAMLGAEIAAVSARVHDAEQRSRQAARANPGTERLWHDEEARSQRKMLYELHRQLDALHRRFPATAVSSQPSQVDALIHS